jgi:hypothetical protein
LQAVHHLFPFEQDALSVHHRGGVADLVLGLLNLTQTQLAVLVLQLVPDPLQLLVPQVGELPLELGDKLVFKREIFLCF